MSGSMSLEKSIRTCDVNTGEANRIQSDRFLNSNNMVCIPWNGLNNKGQEVCPDSFYTKTPGCDSAEDRVLVENSQRPKYMNYVTLGAQGIAGNIYGDQPSVNTADRYSFNKSRDQISGNFGLQWGSHVSNSSCTVGAYERAMAQMSKQVRQQNYTQNASLSSSSRSCSGGY
jgi:hypothetical protein